MKFTKKTTLLVLLNIIFILAILLIVFIELKRTEKKVTTTKAEISPAIVSIFDSSNRNDTEVELKTVGENLSDDGRYSVTFSLEGKNLKGTQSDKKIELLIALEKDKCGEGNGQLADKSVRYSVVQGEGETYCFTPWEDDQYQKVTLDSSNGFAQSITTTTTQSNQLSCGSFQTDIWVLSLNGSENYRMENNQGKQWDSPACPRKRSPQYSLSFEGKTYGGACMINAWGNKKTGKELASCQVPTSIPTATPSPTQGVTLTPTPTATVVPSSTPTATPLPSSTPTPTATVVPSSTPTATPGPGTPTAPPPTPTLPPPTATLTSVPSNTLTPTEIILAKGNTPTTASNPTKPTVVPTIPKSGTPSPWLLMAIPLIFLVAGLLF